MFSPMRRKEKQMSATDAIETLAQTRFGTLACIGLNGYPYSVPLNYVLENNTIYFHSAKNGAKLENILHNKNVSFSAVRYERLLSEQFDTEYDSVIAFGEAALVTDEQEKRSALLLLIEKYSPGFRRQGLDYIERAANAVAVVKIQVQHMTGKCGR